MTYGKTIEDAVGFFEIALSFASDAEKSALSLAAFAEFHGLRCYHYKQFVVRQSGLDIRAVMAFVYSTARQIVIFDSPLYLASAATRFEHAVIARCSADRRISVVAAGGRGISLPNRDVHLHSAYSNAVALAIVRNR